MIGTSLWDYVFIRSCIFCLHFAAPISALYCVVILVLRPSAYRIPVALEIWAVAETLFLLLIYLPRSYTLQQLVTHPPTRSREKRRELFQLCHESIVDPERYLSKWFKGAPLAEIRRENLKEFFCWAFLNKPSYGILEDEELEEYADKMESLLGRKLQPGRGQAISLRLTVDRVKMLHRSILWYLVSPRCEMTEATTTPQRYPWHLAFADITTIVCLHCRFYHLCVHDLPFVSVSSSINQALSDCLSFSSLYAIDYS